MLNLPTASIISLVAALSIAGCGDSNAPATVSATSAAPAAEDVASIPTVDEAREDADTAITESNVDEAVRRLEAELDADGVDG